MTHRRPAHPAGCRIHEKTAWIAAQPARGLITWACFVVRPAARANGPTPGPKVIRPGGQRGGKGTLEVGKEPLGWRSLKVWRSPWGGFMNQVLCSGDRRGGCRSIGKGIVGGEPGTVA